jgi:hypothetical protein
VWVEEMLGSGFDRWRGEERGCGQGGGAAHWWTAIDGLVARCAAISGGRGWGRVGRRQLSAWRTRGEGRRRGKGKRRPGSAAGLSQEREAGGSRLKATLTGGPCPSVRE